MRRRPDRAPLAALLALAVLLTGCRAPTCRCPAARRTAPLYRVTVEFADVLDLVPQAAVKVDDVTVGSVEKIWLAGWTARVAAAARDATSSCRPTRAPPCGRPACSARSTSRSPRPTDRAARGTLADGDLIPLARTRRAAEVEEVLGALSLLLNGGGLAQLQTINRELDTALAGRETRRPRPAEPAGHVRRRRWTSRRPRWCGRSTRWTGSPRRLAAQRAVIGTALDALAPA